MSTQTVTDPIEVAAMFGRHLARTGLAEKTKEAYGRESRNFCAWLADTDVHQGADVFTDTNSRDYAVRDYRRYLLTERKRAPKGVELAITACSALFAYLSMPGLDVPRAGVGAKRAPKALGEDDARRVLRAAEQRGPRDHLIVALAMGAGLRRAEISALDYDDVWVSERKGSVQVRAGKGDKPRTVSLNKDVREAVSGFLAVRGHAMGPLFSAPRGGDRLSGRTICHIVSVVGDAAGVEVSPHTLRHTFATNLVRAGVDMPTVAELMGHSSIETTRVYSRPTHEDAEAAVEFAAIGL